MEPPKNRVSNDLSSVLHLAPLSNFQGIWNALSKPPVRPSVVKVRDLGPHHSIQVALAENEHVV